MHAAPPLPLQVILLFQNVDGVDLCLYCVYVQEYGDDVPPPNRKSGAPRPPGRMHVRALEGVAAAFLPLLDPSSS